MEEARARFGGWERDTEEWAMVPGKELGSAGLEIGLCSISLCFPSLVGIISLMPAKFTKMNFAKIIILLVKALCSL